MRARLPALALVLLLLGACALPRSGPDRAEVSAPPAPAGPRFELVPVTADVLAATAPEPRPGFSAAFTRAREEAGDALAPGDILAVTVWENTDAGLLNPAGVGAASLPRAEVDGRGRVFVPYVGEIAAAGRSPADLRATIRAALARQTLNPQVDVQALERRGRAVAVQGRVGAPGVYPLGPGARRLLPMLARAGGVPEDPQVMRLTLRRGAASESVWLADLYDRPENDVALRAGDIVIAERDRRSFTALGAVRGPASIPFPARDLPLVRALGLVGGLSDAQGDPTGIFVFRREAEAAARRLLPPGLVAGPTNVVYLLDLTQPGGMFLARDFLLRDGDTLYATAAPFVQWLKVLQAVAPVVNFAGSVQSLATP